MLFSTIRRAAINGAAGSHCIGTGFHTKSRWLTLLRLLNRQTWLARIVLQCDAMRCDGAEIQYGLAYCRGDFAPIEFELNMTHALQTASSMAPPGTVQFRSNKKRICGGRASQIPWGWGLLCLVLKLLRYMYHMWIKMMDTVKKIAIHHTIL